MMAPAGGPVRAGTGYDIHRLVPGRALVLGGVVVPHEQGLLSHSDGDALTHAVIDALFGACGLPDIGQHFSPRDPRWRDARSIGLLEIATRLAAAAGWSPHSVDSTVVCERPRLAPYVDAMRANLAQALGVPHTVVNVKAKTNEGLDAIGRGEAIAAHVILLVSPLEPAVAGRT